MNLRQMIDAVLLRASLESGIDTQTYADDAIVQLIQSTFDTLFDMYWWSDFLTPNDTSYALDGVTGTVTTDISPVLSRFKDIRYVWYGTYQDPLPRAPIRANPSVVLSPCVQVNKDPTKVFTILPITSSDTITLAYRTKPANFINETDVIPFDQECVILGTAYDYINSLGLNPGAEQKLQAKYQNRIETLMKEEQNMDVPMGYPQNAVPTGWNWY